jgi:hypothetical protein
MTKEPTSTPPVTRPNHPWNRGYANRQKLAEAKKVGRKRYMKTYNADHYDELKKLDNRNRHRLKVGIPLESPVMAASECFKGYQGPRNPAPTDPLTPPAA